MLCMLVLHDWRVAFLEVSTRKPESRQHALAGKEGAYVLLLSPKPISEGPGPGSTAVANQRSLPSNIGFRADTRRLMDTLPNPAESQTTRSGSQFPTNNAEPAILRPRERSASLAGQANEPTREQLLVELLLHFNAVGWLRILSFFTRMLKGSKER